MAELSPIPSARQRPTDQAYQPVSGYAVAAACVAGGFLLLLLALVLAALSVKRSVLLYELLILPAVGLVLAVLARSHVRNAEGTRIGLRLATLSWWVCVLGGAGYGAYLYANEFVLERESAAVAEKFFTELKANRVEHSFLYLVPPEERDRAQPEAADAFAVAYAKGGFLDYRRHDIVRLLGRSGGDVAIERTGVKDIKQEGGSFHATHIYRVQVPEGTFEVQVKMTATEPRRGGKPVWQIPNRPAPNIAVKLIELSEFGRLSGELEQEADQFAKTWMMHLALNHPTMAHSMTVPAGDREDLEKMILGPAALAGGPAFAAPLTPDRLPPGRREARRLNLYGPALLAGGGATSPGRLAQVAFDDLADLDFFKRDELNSPYPADKWAKLRDLWANPRLAPATTARQMFDVQVQPDPVILHLKDGGLVVNVPAELFENVVTFDRCTIGVISDNPAIAAAVAEVRAKGWRAPAAPSYGISSLPGRDWRIGWLRTDMEALPIVSGAPRPGG